MITHLTADEILALLLRQKPGFGLPLGHAARIVIQPLIDSGMIEVLGKGNCGGFFCRATDAARKAKP
jgi:hypothetical protein